MALKRIPQTGKIFLKEADGSPMINEATGEQEWALVHSPASKFWENAMAARRRKVLKRVRESGGKFEGGGDTAEDKIEFLLAVTEEFSPGVIEGLPHAASMKEHVAAIFNEPEFGYVRDQIDAAAQDWGAFLDASQKLPNSTSASSPG